MKDKIIGIVLSMVLASGIFLSVFGSGEGASQKWVRYQITEAITNSEYKTDLKLEELRKQIQSSNSEILNILSNTNDTNAISKAINISLRNTAPIADYILDKAVKIGY